MSEAELSSFVEILNRLDSLASQIEMLKSDPYKWLPSVAGIGSVFIALLVGLWARDTAKRQMRIQKETAVAQIEAAREQSIRQLEATVVSTSRRQWIEELRSKISKLVALIDDIDTLFAIKQNPEPTKLNGLLELKTHIELMLNHDEPGHMALIAAIRNAVHACYARMDCKTKAEHDVVQNKILSELLAAQNAARVVFKTEWNKVKNLE